MRQERDLRAAFESARQSICAWSHSLSVGNVSNLLTFNVKACGSASFTSLSVNPRSMISRKLSVTMDNHSDSQTWIQTMSAVTSILYRLCWWPSHGIRQPPEGEGGASPGCNAEALACSSACPSHQPWYSASRPFQ